MNNPRNAPAPRHYAPIAEETARLLGLPPSDVEVVPYEKTWEKSWHAGSHTAWDGDLAKAEVKHPGSRGGHGYYNDQGEWQYGVRPIDDTEPESDADHHRFAVSVYHALNHVPTHQELLDMHTRAYGSEGSFMASVAIDGARRAAAAEDAGIEHDEHGYQTSPKLRMWVQDVASRGYRISDGTEEEHITKRLLTWKAVADVVEDLEKAVPGIRPMLLRHPLELRVISVDTDLGGVRGEFERPLSATMRSTLTVHPKYARSFMHEMGHYIDNVMAIEHPAEMYDFRHMATNDMPHTQAAQLIGKLKQTDAYQSWIKGRTKNIPYWSRPSETFGRFFDAWVGHELGKGASDTYEPYTEQDFATFGEELRSILRPYGLVKSFLRWAAGSHAR